MESEISWAVHADAEAARAEIRAAGIICPSCGINMADLPPRHHLADVADSAAIVPLPGHTLKCGAGTAVDMPVTDFETLRSAANVMVIDRYNASLDRAWSEMPGFDINEPAPAREFTGLLDTIGKDSEP